MGINELIAQGVRPVENPINSLAQATELQGMQQRNQLGAIQQQSAQLALRQQQNDQKDLQLATQAYAESGGDYELAGKMAARNGASMKVIESFRQAAEQSRQHAIEEVKTKGAKAIQDAGLMYDAHQQVASLPPELRQEGYKRSLAMLQQAGIDVSQAPPDYPGDQQFQLLGMALGAHQKQVAEAEAKAKTAKDNAEAIKAARPEKVPVAEQQMAAWLAKPENKGKDAADYEVAMKKIVPAYNFNLQQNATKLSDPAVDNAAEQYWNTGKLPPVGRGAAGQSRISAIMNRAAELHQGENIAEGSAAFAANKKSLESLQKNFDQVSAFESTALKNITLLEETAKKIPDLGSRFANIPARMISDKLLGTDQMAAFKTALNTAQTEAAKVLNSSNASGVLSDSARHELQDIVDGKLPYSAMVASLNTLRQDMSNRHAAYQQQIEDIRGRMVGKKTQPQGGTQQQGGNDPFAQFGGVKH